MGERQVTRQVFRVVVVGDGVPRYTSGNIANFLEDSLVKNLSDTEEFEEGNWLDVTAFPEEVWG